MTNTQAHILSRHATGLLAAVLLLASAGCRDYNNSCDNSTEHEGPDNCTILGYYISNINDDIGQLQALVRDPRFGKTELSNLFAYNPVAGIYAIRIRGYLLEDLRVMYNSIIQHSLPDDILMYALDIPREYAGWQPERYENKHGDSAVLDIYLAIYSRSETVHAKRRTLTELAKWVGVPAAFDDGYLSNVNTIERLNKSLDGILEAYEFYMEAGGDWHGQPAG